MRSQNMYNECTRTHAANGRELGESCQAAGATRKVHPRIKSKPSTAIAADNLTDPLLAQGQGLEQRAEMRWIVN